MTGIVERLSRPIIADALERGVITSGLFAEKLVMERIEAAAALRDKQAEIERQAAEIKALREACDKLGFWMSAALDDPNVCKEMKNDINAWFAALTPKQEASRSWPTR